MPAPDTAETLIRSFTADINAGDFGAIERYFADGYLDRHDNDEGVDELIDAERERYDAFPDKHEEIDVILEGSQRQGDAHLEVWYMVDGSHQGSFLNLPATGNEVTFPLLRNLLIDDGRITRYRVVYTLGFLLDLGVDWEALTDTVEMDRFLTSPAAAGSARAD